MAGIVKLLAIAVSSVNVAAHRLPFVMAHS
jgi:hypothetical protein